MKPIEHGVSFRRSRAMPEHLFGRLARSGFVESQCRQASIAAVHSIMNDGNIGSCPERAWASITLRKYLNERTFAGLSSQDWGRPRPKWPGSRPIARQAGRATEPRLVGSRRSRPIGSRSLGRRRRLLSASQSKAKARATMIVHAAPRAHPTCSSSVRLQRSSAPACGQSTPSRAAANAYGPEACS